MMNIYSYLYPQELEWLPCSANFRPDFCLSTEACKIESNGLILHGNRGPIPKANKGKIREYPI